MRVVKSLPPDARVLEFPFSSRPAEHVQDGGYVRLMRRIFTAGDSCLGRDFRLVGAWVAMICEAAWQPTDVQFGETWIRLQRGQLVMDYRSWAARAHLPLTTFYRACKRMEKEGRIRLEVKRLRNGLETAITLVTICNYDLYQASSDDVETAPEQGRNVSKEEKEGKERKVSSESRHEGQELESFVPPNGSTHDVICDLDAALFRFGVSVLGVRNRSVVAKLKKAKGTEEALRIIERARTRQDALTYVLAACKDNGRQHAQTDFGRYGL